MPYKQPIVEYYDLDFEDITPRHYMSEVINKDKVHMLATAGYCTKLDIRDAEDQDLIEAYPSQFGLPARLTEEDVRRLRKWTELGEYEEGQAIALFNLVLKRRVSDQPIGRNHNGFPIYDIEKTEVGPGDLVGVEWGSEHLIEESKRIGHIERVRARTPEDK